VAEFQCFGMKFQRKEISLLFWSESHSKSEKIFHSYTSILSRIYRGTTRKNINSFRNFVVVPNASLEARMRIRTITTISGYATELALRIFVVANGSIIDRSHVIYALEAAKQSSLFSLHSFVHLLIGRNFPTTCRNYSHI